MIKDVISLLTELGLTDSESKVYLASLELGPTSVQDIAKKAGLSRTATYDIVDSLKEYGLMSTYESGRKRFFAAEDPDNAVLHFKERIHSLEKKVEKLNNILPEVKMMAGGEKPTVRFYEGKEAVFAAFHDVEKVQPKMLHEVTNYKYVRQHMDQDMLERARKSTKNISAKILHHGDFEKPLPNKEYCKLLPDLDDFQGDIWIYKNRVVFFTFFGKMTTVIIKSQPLADVARVLFQAAWQICSTHHDVQTVDNFPPPKDA